MTAVRPSLVALVLALALVACGGGSDGATSSTATTVLAAGPGRAAVLVEPAQASTVAAADGTIVLDVRTADEFAAGHLEGARLVDVSSPEFTSTIGGLDRSATYLVYCHSGNRSAVATSAMTELGFTDVYELAGGIAAWEAAGQRVVR